ncbi:MAG: rRNA maturation RNase YbeY [Actinobacteria bacterium]|nr:rRNA maturation RNase YbeY [Actinomycetota bacterium]
MRVAVNTNTAFRIHTRALKRAGLRVMKAEGVRRDALLSISLISPQEIGDINHRYLGREGPTDVLAFPMQEESEGRFLLGDVIICPEYIAERREEYGVDEGKELEYVAVHGILHLLGYEDDDEEGALAMDRRQREILGVAEEETR